MLEVTQVATILDDGLGKLPEHTIHVGALTWPQALKEANMAPMTGDQQGQVRVLLHCLHWNGWIGEHRKSTEFN